MEHMKDVMNLAVVNFKPVWGNKEANLNRMLGYIESAAKRGADMIVMPEVCLTGYDDLYDVERSEKMQTKLAEEIPGPSTEKVCEYAKEYNIIVVFGMPERDHATGRVFNTAVIIGPEGVIDAYRKIHLPNREPDWADRGDRPVVFDTPWGKVGIGICYDVYNFPELIAYAAAKGARLFLNPTAIGWGVSSGRVFRTKTESDCLRSNIYIASANLVGKDLYYEFTGCSHIMGPVGKHGDVCYYAGHPFGDPEGEVPGMFIGTIDLALVDYQSINTFKNLYHTNPVTNTTDWRPDLYARMFAELAESEEWKGKTIK